LTTIHCIDGRRGKAAPWKKLVGDPKATTITLESLQERINPLLEDIRKKQEERIGVTSEQ
jgi:hypothetical protein